MSSEGKTSNLMSKSKLFLLAGAAGAVVLVGSIYVSATKNTSEEVTRNYTIPEKQLAIDVKDYLGKYVLIEDEESEKIAEKAIAAYDKIVDSNVSTLTNEHVDALEDSIGLVLNDLVTDEQLTKEDKVALSSGIAQIILNSILEQIEGSTFTYDPEFEEEYLSLVDSLQMQINDLNDRTYQFKINARVEKGEGGVSEEKLEEIYKEIYEASEDNYDALSEDFQDELDDLRDELEAEIERETRNVKDGKDGKNGKDGKDGVGKDGVDGKDGQNGKSTYIFFADDADGTNFSQTFSENSKYMASITTNVDPKTITKSDLAGKWEKYRDLGLSATTDENGKTTITINVMEMEE